MAEQVKSATSEKPEPAPSERDERFKIEGDPEDALRRLLKVDPESHDGAHLTLDEAYRAAYHFINQYYERERIEPFMLMLSSMGPWNAERPELRVTSDPATWNDWLASVHKALASPDLPEPHPLLD
jgi:hypothetical protein